MFRLKKKAILKKSPDTKVVDIKIEKIFRKLFTQKGVKVTKAEVLFYCRGIPLLLNKVHQAL